MYQDSKHMCTAIVLLIKPFVWRRHGLLKLPFVTAREFKSSSQHYFRFITL